MLPREFPVLETERLVLTIPTPEEAVDLLDFHERNRAHLSPWMPIRPESFYTIEYWRRRLMEERREFLMGLSLCLVVRLREDRAGPVIAEARFRNFVRGSFHACHLGYHIDQAYEGRGMMQESLEAAIDYAFQSLNLHRIMANYIPTNARSGALLRRLGFDVEGYARDYLFIDGAWRDHILTAKHNPLWRIHVSGQDR